MAQNNQPEGTSTRTWLEAIKAIGPLLIVGTIIVGIWRFQVEREREAASRYLNIIRDLGNDSNSVRAGAVITMDTYLRQRGKINEKYREQGIYVLATHLAIEPAPLVRATTEEVLVNIGAKDNNDIVVQKLVCSNRNLWKQSGLTPESLISGEMVRPNLQSIANTLIQIFQRKKRIHSQTSEPLDLSKIYLTPDDYNDYSLKEIELVNVKLECAYLASMDFEKCTMEDCKLNGVYLDYAILKEATLKGIDLKGAHFANAILEGANLEGVTLEGAHLENANLTDANLAGANLEVANLIDANLSNANLAGANLEVAVLPRANLANVNFTDANLAGAILEDANLADANLVRANLANANLAGADLSDVNMQSAELKNTILKARVLFKIDSRKILSDLDKGIYRGTLSEDLRNEFKNNRIYLSKDTSVSIEEENRKWLINDKDSNQTYTVRKEECLKIYTASHIVETELFSIESNKFQSDLDNGNISEGLQLKLEDSVFCLSQNVVVSVEEKGRKWLINDVDYRQTYALRKEDNQLKIYETTKFDPTELFSFDSNDINKLQDNLDEGIISEDLRQKFKKNRIDLSKNITVSIDEKNHTWLINDRDNMQSYTIRKDNVLNICRETKFDFEDIKKAQNWEEAVFDEDIKQKLQSIKLDSEFY